MERALPVRRNAERRICRTGLLAAALASAVVLLAGAQSAQDRESRAASSIAQADELYSQGSYEKAVESYRQATLLSVGRLNLSRAYMGIALCYFYLNDTENAKANILKVLEIDPQKEVSSLFHPQTFIDLFEQVKRDNPERLGKWQPPALAEEPRPAQGPAPGKPVQRVTALSGGKSSVPRGGHWEIGVHYSSWGLNLARDLFEDALLKSASKEIRKNVNNQLVSKASGNLIPSADSHKLVFDSEGKNYGAEIRFYPRGRRGSMSVGFSIEQTNVRLMMKGPVQQDYSDGSSATVDGDAVIETNPVTTHLSFRWDFVPSSRVTPYFIFGLGLGPLNGEASYTYAGTYLRGSQQAAITGDWLKTFDQLRKDGDISLSLMIMAHLALGLKAEVVKGVILQAEAGFWDGLVVRGGLAFRL